jgi:hypothetical protein
MTRKQLYIARLVAGVTVVALFALACSALLDMGGLNSKTSKEAGPPDFKGDFTLPPDKTVLPPDLGKCVGGAQCSTGKPGACAIGKAVCYDGTATGSCLQTVQPTTEVCDGKDTNCNGVGDLTDPAAIADCKSKGMYCNGTACVAGCYDAAGCKQSNTCNTTTHQCACGTKGPCSAPFTCVPAANKCACGSTGKLDCGYNETCDDNAGAGKCSCGTYSSTTGRACPAGTSCKGTPRDCVANPTDAGPDKPKVDQGQPDKTPPDKTPPDTTPPDKTPVDGVPPPPTQ